MIKKFVSCKTSRQTKPNSLGFISIAKNLITVDYTPYPKSFRYTETLKSLARLRVNLARQRDHQLVLIQNTLDKIFFEIKLFF